MEISAETLSILLFCLGFIMGISFMSFRFRKKIGDILNDIKVHYKALDDEQYDLLIKRYGVNKKSWVEKGFQKVKEKKKNEQQLN